jgi:hypothetical protein
MRTTQGSTLQSLRTTDIFLDEHAEKLGDVVKSGARQELRDIIADLAGHVSAQDSGTIVSRGATQKQRQLRALLRAQMAPVARIARAKLGHTPELAALRMPRGKPTIERLSAAAYGMAKAAEPHASTFTASGLPSDFGTRLTGAADVLVKSLSERSTIIARRGGATRDLKAKLSAGRHVVGILDAMVRGTLGTGDPGLLASWNIAKRVKRTAVQPAVVPQVPTAVPSPTPAPVSASSAA